MKKNMNMKTLCIIAALTSYVIGVVLLILLDYMYGTPIHIMLKIVISIIVGLIVGLIVGVCGLHSELRKNKYE